MISQNTGAKITLFILGVISSSITFCWSLKVIVFCDVIGQSGLAVKIRLDPTAQAKLQITDQSVVRHHDVVVVIGRVDLSHDEDVRDLLHRLVKHQLHVL